MDTFIRINVTLFTTLLFNSVILYDFQFNFE